MENDSPQNLHLMKVAFVYTGAGQSRRPRLLILESEAEGISPGALVEEWLLSAKGAQSFTVVHDIRAQHASVERLGPDLDTRAQYLDPLPEEGVVVNEPAAANNGRGLLSKRS